MMRQPQPKRAKTSREMSLPAPTSGWFVAANLAAAPKNTAFKLDNFFPMSDYVRIRKGSRDYAGGLPAPVDTLMVYNTGASQKLFAAVQTGIYDVTNGGTSTTPDVVTTSGQWQQSMVTVTGGQYLYAVNGSDAPRLYDGSAWSIPSFSVTPPATLTPSNLINVWVYKGRPMFIEKRTLNAWYLNADSVSGAINVFSLGGVFRLGGYLVAGESWSVQTSGGLSEQCVFISSEGECAIYSGGYPGASDWQLVGVYRVGRPMGYRCTFKAGGDLAVLCEDGIVPLSKAINYDVAAIINTALTRAIAPEFQRTTATKAALFGWQMISWPIEQMFVVNVPHEPSETPVQFVSNLVTGAWCRYTGWDARCWGLFNNRLMFGTFDGRVIEAEVGGADVNAPGAVVSGTGIWDATQWDVATWDGSGAVYTPTNPATPYTATMFWNYSNLGAAVLRKVMHMGRVNAQASFDLTGSQLKTLVDYDFTPPPAPAILSPIADGARWDEARWDVDTWPASISYATNRWRKVSGRGSMVAPVYQTTVATAETIDLKVSSVDLTYELGQAIG